MKIILCGLGLLLLVARPGANAASSGLFLADGLRQRVAFDYEYHGLTLSTESGEKTDLANHRFEQSYFAAINYAIRGPNLLLGGISVESTRDQLFLSQSSASSRNKSSSSGSRVLYDINGTFLRKHPVSFSFFSNSKRGHVSREFSPGYDQSLYFNGLSMQVRGMIPFSVAYRQTEAKTDGLTSDYQQRNKTVRIDAKHSVRQRSQTFLDLNFDDYKTRYDDGRDDYELQASQFRLRNDLTWSAGKKRRRLTSRGEYSEQEGAYNLQGYDWSEYLDWYIGQALIGKLSYHQSYTDREANDLLRKQGRAELHHHFLDCIDTRIGVDGRAIRQGDGKENERSGDFNFSYSNKLSRGNFLQANFYREYGIVERDFNSGFQSVIDETHRAGMIVPIILERANVQSDTVEVRHSDPAVRLEPYVVDLDYQVEQIGVTTLITILPGSDIPDGSDLLINYTYLDNPQEEYSYTTSRISASLDFLQRYRIHGRWGETVRDYRSDGELLTHSKGDLREAVLGFEATWPSRHLGLEYANRSFDYEDRQSLEAYYRWSQAIARGVLDSGLTNHYDIIKPASGGDEYQINTFSVKTRYQTRIFKRGSLGLYGNYAVTNGEVNDRDDISVGFDYRYAYGKFTISIDGKVDWRLNDGQDRREDRVNMQISRYL